MTGCLVRCGQAQRRKRSSLGVLQNSPGTILVCARPAELPLHLNQRSKHYQAPVPTCMDRLCGKKTKCHMYQQWGKEQRLEAKYSFVIAEST